MSALKYKVGDKVLIKDNDIEGTVESIIRGQFIVDIKGSKIPVWPEDIVLMKSAKEETKPKFKVGDTIKSKDSHTIYLDDNHIFTITKIDKGIYWSNRLAIEYIDKQDDWELVPEENMTLVEKENKPIDLTVKGEEAKERIEIAIPEGYEYVIESNKIIFTKKKKEYPKTYEECLNVLGYEDIATHCIFHTAADERLFDALYSLKICRDAYWKIAGEEIGLGKPWEPDWKDEEQDKYGFHNEVQYTVINSATFVFPTPEMRDAFKENFDPNIEICKEFL